MVLKEVAVFRYILYGKLALDVSVNYRIIFESKQELMPRKKDKGLE
jgi:hypothetical protein